MRLDEIWIGEYKNLKDLTIDFDETSSYTVLVGQNGSGKSNLIEAIAYIFRNLDLELEAPFSYSIKYVCRGRDINITAQENQFPSFSVREDDSDEFIGISRKQFMRVDDLDRPLYRPAFVFGYYSGPSDRLSSIFERHRERFYSFIIQPKHKRKKQFISSNSLRRLFYAQTLHGQFALLSFFMKQGEEDSDIAFLKEHLQIEELDSVLFALKRPPWRRRGGDKRFWNAEGEVRDFLGKLYDVAEFPMRMDRRLQVDIAKNPSVECLYLSLPHATALQEVYRTYSDQYAFFTALESMHISKILLEVRTRVRMTQEFGSAEITYRDLSEGEQQLLLVLGLLKFTAEDEALFLLDEPDTHLNPKWSTQYLSFLNSFIQDRQGCHVIMTTHDPLVFSSLCKEQVRIFQRNDNGNVRVEIPLQDPRGMGVQAILTSDLFRLRTTLDLETQRELDLLHTLSSKTEELTPQEEEELERVRTQLEENDFWTSDRDPIYSLFLRKWTHRQKPEWIDAVDLSPEDIDERDRLADKILDEIESEIVKSEAKDR